MSAEAAGWTVAPADAGQALAAFLRARTGKPWREVKRLVATGKVFVGGAAAREEGRRLAAGEAVELRMSTPRARPDEAAGPAPEALEIVFEDTHLVVVDKPAGIASVPLRAGEDRSAIDLVRALWRKQGRRGHEPLHKVHRIDKPTSGLLVYARTEHARGVLFQRWKEHAIERAYLCVAQGAVPAGTIEARLIADRGDGLRWTARPGQPGKDAISRVEPLEALRGATLCRVRLETGRNHQIRIHLAASGHPLLGEAVYARDLVNQGVPLLPAPRLMLHAALLGFPHPVSGAPLRFERPPPPDFQAVVASLRQA